MYLVLEEVSSSLDEIMTELQLECAYQCEHEDVLYDIEVMMKIPAKNSLFQFSEV